MDFDQATSAIISVCLSDTCLAMPTAKNEALILVATLRCVFDGEIFTKSMYDSYMSLIFKWVETFGGRTYIMNRSFVQEIRNRRFTVNDDLTSMVIQLIHSFDKLLFSRFGFEPSKTSQQKAIERSVPTSRHRRSQSQPIPLTSTRGVSITFHMHKIRTAPDADTCGSFLNKVC